MKKILVQFNFPNMPAKKYEAAWDALRATGNTDFPGLIFHVGAQQGNDFVVIDVWESEEAFKKFGETTLGPIMQKVGIPNIQPKISPVLYTHSGKKAAVAL